MPNTAANSHKVKRRRSLKKPEQRQKVQIVDEKRVLPIDIEQSELDSILTRISTGQEANPQAAFSKIYALALDSIADTIKASLVSLVKNAASQDLPPFLNSLVPSKDPKVLNAIADSIAQKIDASKERIQLSLAQKAQEPSRGNYENFTESLQHNGLIDVISKKVEQTTTSLLPNHITADRLREICSDLRNFKPEKTSSDTYRIDLSRIPKNTQKIAFKADMAKPTGDVATKAETQDETCAVTTSNDPDVVPETIADTAETLENAKDEPVTLETETPDVAVEPVDGSCTIAEPAADATNKIDDEITSAEVDTPTHAEVVSETDENTNSNAGAENLDQDASSPIAQKVTETVGRLTEQLDLTQIAAQGVPQFIEQAFLSAALQNQTGTPAPISPDDAKQVIEQFGVEVVESFDGFTDMLTEFANQLSAAIIDAHADRFATLTEALQDDPRMEDDAELKDFVSFLDADETPQDDASSSDELDNDELAAAFGCLLDMLDSE